MVPQYCICSMSWSWGEKKKDWANLYRCPHNHTTLLPLTFLFYFNLSFYHFDRNIDTWQLANNFNQDTIERIHCLSRILRIMDQEKQPEWPSWANTEELHQCLTLHNPFKGKTLNVTKSESITHDKKPNTFSLVQRLLSLLHNYPWVEGAN